jgi:hypothetical protein
LKEARKPKYESYYLTDLKKIKQVYTNSIWYFDKIFKDVMGKLMFQIPDKKHREWFIA